MDEDEIVIVGADGTEHVFPAGFNPKRAAAIVRGGSASLPAKPFRAEDYLTPEQIRNRDSDRGWPATLWEVAKGGAKGLASTAASTIGELAVNAGMVPGVTPAGFNPAFRHPVFRAIDEATEAENIPQQVGKLGEFAVETAIPAARAAAAIPGAVRAIPGMAAKLVPAARQVAREGFIGAARKTALNALGDTLERAAAKAAPVATEAETAPVKLGFGRKSGRMRFGYEAPEPVAIAPVVPASPNAGGRLVREKAPTLPQVLSEALDEAAQAPPPARVTTPPPAGLPPGYTPRTTAPKPKAAPKATRKRPASPEMGPKGYFLRKPEPVPAVEPKTGPITEASLPASWRGRTNQPLVSPNSATGKQWAAQFADELQARGLSAEDAIVLVSKNPDLPPMVRLQIVSALKQVK